MSLEVMVYNIGSIDDCLYQFTQEKCIATMNKRHYMRDQVKQMNGQNKLKTKKNYLMKNNKHLYDRNSSKTIAITNDKRIKQQILSKMLQSQQRHKLQYESNINRVRVSINFNNKYNMKMLLPQCFSIRQLAQLIGYYTKLHWKHRPSDQHIYSGLIIKSIFINKQQQQQIIQRRVNRQQQQILQKREQTDRQINRQNDGQQSSYNQCKQEKNTKRYVYNMVRYLMGSIILAQQHKDKHNQLYNDNITFPINIKGTLQQLTNNYIDQLQQLNQNQSPITTKHHIQQINLQVKYDQIINTENSHIFPSIVNKNNNSNNEYSKQQINKQSEDDEQQDDKMIEMDNQQLITLNPRQCQLYHQPIQFYNNTPKQSIFKSNNINMNNNKYSDYQLLMKWFTQTQLADWLSIYHLLTNYHQQNFNNSHHNKHYKQSKHTNSKTKRKQFILSDKLSDKVNDFNDYTTNIKLFPIRKKQTQQYYILTVITIDQLLPIQQINSKINQIQSYFITNRHNLLYSHTLKQLYCINKKDKDNNNIKENNNNKENINNSNMQYSYSDKINNNDNGCVIMIMQISHYRTINLQQYLKHLFAQFIQCCLQQQNNNSQQKGLINNNDSNREWLQYRVKIIFNQIKRLLKQLNVVNHNRDRDGLQQYKILSLFQVQISQYNHHPHKQQQQQKIKILINSISLLNIIYHSTPSYINSNKQQQIHDNYGRRRRVNMNRGNTNQYKKREYQQYQQVNNKLLYYQIKQIIDFMQLMQQNISIKKYIYQLLSQCILSNSNKPTHILAYSIQNNDTKTHNRSNINNSKLSIISAKFINHLYQSINLFVYKHHQQLSSQQQLSQYNDKQYQQQQITTINSLLLDGRQQSALQLQSLKQYLINNQHNINIYHTYHTPIIYHLKQNQPINLYQKETTLKKSHSSSNTNNKSNTDMNNKSNTNTNNKSNTNTNNKSINSIHHNNNHSINVSQFNSAQIKTHPTNKNYNKKSKSNNKNKHNPQNIPNNNNNKTTTKSTLRK